ncbi:MAG: adenylosuccinate synthetase [Anaerolineales bacterium]|nr:adenylosuccinate synthetase [Anaerolineales bacterium]
MRAFIIIDLGFGDSGKGILTDFLTRRLNASLVIRYNGGAQAGHHVVTPDGRQHTFSQFGSGTFNPGVKTYLSKHVIIHPGALLIEGDKLVGMGIRDAYSRLRISDQAVIITPFHQAANRIREIVRGQNRHGSCGVGFGEAVEDSLTDPDSSLRAKDLANLPVLKHKLHSIRQQKRQQLVSLCRGKLHPEALAREWQIFERSDVIDTWMAMISQINSLGLVASDNLLQNWLQTSESAIFEGAQGVLLDAEAGFHPYTTWSNCTIQNARELINTTAPDSQVYQIGVLRSHAVRHGPGPLPSETDELGGLIYEHNQTNEWQGRVRYGWFDAVLARYALSITGKLDALAVTHMDLLSKLNTWKYCQGYTGKQDLYKYATSYSTENIVTNFHFPDDLSLEQKSQFTRALSSVLLVFENCEAEENTVRQKIEALLAHPVGIISKGLKAEDVKTIIPFPS